MTTTTTTTGSGRCAPRDGGHGLFSFRNLHRAWLACRRNKRGSPAALRFELDAEENLFDLRDSLASRTYRPSPFCCFVTDRPKCREIFAAPFHDRVVHHLVVSHLEPLWEPVFIHDSYACRKGRGTHAAVERLRGFMRKATANGTRRAWFLHLDVRSFFVRIDKEILFDTLERRLDKSNPPWKGDMLHLLRAIVFQDPTLGVEKKGRPALFARVPSHKSLFHTGNATGLPIGNHTSQFFANVYLDRLDQFVKHGLKCRFYLRYVDDLVLVDPDRDRLLAWEKEIARFLWERLKLELNPRSRVLAPVSNGCDFLGYVVRPSHLLVRRRVERRCRKMLDEAGRRLVRPWGKLVRVDHDPAAVGALRASLASYLGHFGHASAHRLEAGILARNPWLGEYFAFWRRPRGTGGPPVRPHRLEAGATSRGTGGAALRPHRLEAGATPRGARRKRRRPTRLRPMDAPPRFRRLRDQWLWLRGRGGWLPLLVRVGRYVECYGRDAVRLGAALGLRMGARRKGLGARAGFPARLLAEHSERLAAAGVPHACAGQTGLVRGRLAERVPLYACLVAGERRES